MHLRLILLLFIGAGCYQTRKTSDCIIDYEFKSRFQNCINIIAVREAGIFIDRNAYTAYYCLQSLTGERGYMDLNSDTPLAYNYSDTINFFCKDLEVWLKWYDQNKCSFTMKDAQAVLKKDSLDWPLYLEEMKNLECELHIVK